MPPRDAIGVLTSGGIDSAVLSVSLLRTYRCVYPVYVEFGLRWESVERLALESFLKATQRPGLMPLTVLREPASEVYRQHWSVSGEDVPDFASPDESVYLPGRNLLLISKVAVWCHLKGIERLALGVLRSNPFPDSTPPFYNALNDAVSLGLDTPFAIERPFDSWTKRDVMRAGRGLPLELTFSCLDPQSGIHCGRCNKCAERRRGFVDAGIADVTPYLNTPEPPSRIISTCIGSPARFLSATDTDS